MLMGSYQLYCGWLSDTVPWDAPSVFAPPPPPTQAGPLFPLLPLLPCGFHRQNSDLDCLEEATLAII